MNPFSHLTWHRLQFSLVNTRPYHLPKAHIVSIDAIVKSVSRNLTPDGSPEDPAPSVFFHLARRRHTFKLHQSERLGVEVLFVNADRDWVNAWRATLQTYLASKEGGQNFSLVQLGDVEARTYDMLACECQPVTAEGELCLEFLTPVPFRPENPKERTLISKEQFVGLFERRFRRLFDEKCMYGSEADDFGLATNCWHYTEIRRPSVSQPGSVRYINGCVGRLYLSGAFGDFLPFLILGSELHAGASLASGQGYYRLGSNW